MLLPLCVCHPSSFYLWVELLWKQVCRNDKSTLKDEYCINILESISFCMHHISRVGIHAVQGGCTSCVGACRLNAASVLAFRSSFFTLIMATYFFQAKCNDWCLSEAIRSYILRDYSIEAATARVRDDLEAIITKSKDSKRKDTAIKLLNELLNEPDVSATLYLIPALRLC